MSLIEILLIILLIVVILQLVGVGPRVGVPSTVVWVVLIVLLVLLILPRLRGSGDAEIGDVGQLPTAERVVTPS